MRIQDGLCRIDLTYKQREQRRKKSSGREINIYIHIQEKQHTHKRYMSSGASESNGRKAFFRMSSSQPPPPCGSQNVSAIDSRVCIACYKLFLLFYFYFVKTHSELNRFHALILVVRTPSLHRSQGVRNHYWVILKISVCVCVLVYYSNTSALAHLSHARRVGHLARHRLDSRQQMKHTRHTHRLAHPPHVALPSPHSPKLPSGDRLFLLE